MATSDEELDLREAGEQDGSGGRRGRPGLGARLRRGRGGGTDVAERPGDTMPGPGAGADDQPGAVTQPVTPSEVDGWFSLVEPVEYDEWGDPIVKGTPRGPGTVGLRRSWFPRDDEGAT